MKTIHGCEVNNRAYKLISDFAEKNGFKEAPHSLEYCLTGLYFFIGDTKYHLGKNGEIVNVLNQAMINELMMASELG